MTAATLAFEHGGVYEQQAAAKSWKTLAEEFWQRTAEDDKAKKLKAPKLNRTRYLGSAIIFR